MTDEPFDTTAGPSRRDRIDRPIDRPVGRCIDRPVGRCIGRASGMGSSPAADYVRERDLPRLIGLWPSDLAPASAVAQSTIVARLRRALRQERRRASRGRGGYDLARHARLLAAYRAELARDGPK